MRMKGGRRCVQREKPVTDTEEEGRKEMCPDAEKEGRKASIRYRGRGGGRRCVQILNKREASPLSDTGKRKEERVFRYQDGRRSGCACRSVKREALRHVFRCCRRRKASLCLVAGTESKEGTCQGIGVS